MKIHFFEEYPTEKNLQQLKKITFPTRVYIAAKTVREFNSIAQKIEEQYSNVEVAYWPVLEKSYWISPFSNTEELKGLQEELQHNNSHVPVLLDLELPFLKKILFLKNIRYFRRNKRLIREIIGNGKKHNYSVHTAEYPPVNRLGLWLMRILGISYSQKLQHDTIVMMYMSMIPRWLQRFVKQGVRGRKKTVEVGLGTIATGVLGNEPMLSTQELEKNIQFCKEEGIETIVVFRLGGVHKKHNTILQKHYT